MCQANTRGPLNQCQGQDDPRRSLQGESQTRQASASRHCEPRFTQRKGSPSTNTMTLFAIDTLCTRAKKEIPGWTIADIALVDLVPEPPAKRQTKVASTFYPRTCRSPIQWLAWCLDRSHGRCCHCIQRPDSGHAVRTLIGDLSGRLAASIFASTRSLRHAAAHSYSQSFWARRPSLARDDAPESASLLLSGQPGRTVFRRPLVFQLCWLSCQQMEHWQFIVHACWTNSRC